MSVKLKYALKQQTPMIHFQHDQKGVTLRATEVKPKLDRFINKYYAGQLKKEWKLGETDALNYKIRITAPDGKFKETSDTIGREIEKHKSDRSEHREIDRKYEKENKIINKSYFGNMVSGNDPDFENSVRSSFKETVFYTADIELEIMCFHSGLRELIDQCIDVFFLTTNYGTRQSKGFGSFVLCRENEEFAPEKSFERLVSFLKDANLAYAYMESNNDDSNDLMDIAYAVYNEMKGGANLTKKNRNPESYVKGYIQRQYLDDIGKPKTGSDKAFMKAKVFPGKKHTKNEEKYDDYLFVRALLGLADHYDFRDDERSGTVLIGQGETKGDETHKEEPISRFKSPVTIKIIGNRVFFIFEDSYKLILGATFILSKKGSTIKKEIKVPDSFDPYRFFSDFKKFHKSNKNKLKALGNEYREAANLELKVGE